MAPGPAEKKPPRREDPTGLAPLIGRIDAWVSQTHCFPALERDRESIASLLAQIKKRQASLEAPLRILLLGGTGVGKSTLFNALAGADLARAAAVRPTTRELTAYFHEQNGSGALGPLEARAKLVPHQRALLRDKIVLDAPDFDSTAEENRLLLERALESTDLAVCVVTAEKYLSSELFGLIERHREGLEFVFVLNKLDRAGDGALIVDDLRAELESHGLFGARILRVSSLAVREAQKAAEEAGLNALEAALPEEAGEWRELRHLLEQELDRVRIREIKAAKLADRVRALLSRAEEHVPRETPERVDDWRRAWGSALKDLTQDLSRTFFGAIYHDFELRNILRYLFGTSFPGPFGAFLTVGYGVRSVLMPGYARARSFTATDLEALMGERLRAVQIEHVERRVEVVVERFEQEGRRLGFEPTRPPGVSGRHDRLATSRRFSRGELPEGVAALVVAVRGEAARRFYEIFEETVAGGARATRWLHRAGWNVAPLGVAGMTTWAFFVNMFDPRAGHSLPQAFKDTVPILEGGLISVLVVCVLQWPLAERQVERRITSSLSLLEGVVERAVEDCLGDAVVHEPERILADILDRFREFERLREDAGKVLREEPQLRRPSLAREGAAPPPEGGEERKERERQRTRV